MSHSAKSTVEFVALGLKEVHKLTSEWSLWALKLLLYKKKLTLGSSIVEEFDLLNWQADSGQMLFGIFCFDSEHTPPPVTRHPSWNASFTEGAEEFYHGKINWMEYFSRAGHQPSSFYDAVPPPSGAPRGRWPQRTRQERRWLPESKTFYWIHTRPSLSPPLATLSFTSLQRKTHTANELEPCDEGGHRQTMLCVKRVTRLNREEHL